MCLLDAVSAWDEQQIHCIARSHLSADNPLRQGGRLDALTAIEYAGQAMAIHGSLLQLKAQGGAETEPFAPAQGYLAGVNQCTLYCEDLSQIEEALEILCQRLMADSKGQLYGFEVKAAGRLLACGRVTVILASPGTDD
ncbi:3-hydroxylacyl-ACP dehydratase [Aestuariirhabdus litorea]|uniref:3-hydroxylacyl-ACP dehydratase n=2 Tax=Aestuariirhabdus litorea TaxID=2528527 RepID=A0A3P3VRT7_9GAMM|nr:3-hydroxylacyl-ACP dehydratase [Aestuariirhabdus litorea]RWW98724.1 3-hydroxylacyl-ACP dehydratase [Endozoicomonadaceae bacterium GTF-13]